MVTIKKIAEICGVSRGTVDRVLNRRGRCKPETAEKIWQVARQLGYQPNPAGKALAARKHHPVVGVILPSEGNAFFDEVIKGLEISASMYAIYGLKMELHRLKGYSVRQQVQKIQEIAEDINALIIAPVNDPKIAKALNALVDRGILVIAVNTDIEDCRYHAYVGTDYYNGGETACALFEALLGKRARLGVVLGSYSVLGHRERLDGFRSRMEKLPDFSIAAIIENEDDEFFSYGRTKEMLAAHPSLDALFIVAGGAYGACRAVAELEEAERPMVIAFDSVPSTVEMMKRGIVRAILYQHPYRQGRRSMDIAFEYLVNGIEPRRRRFILKNEIKLLENL